MPPTAPGKRREEDMRRASIAALAGLLAGALALGAGGAVPAQTPFRPVATVNKSIITAYDVDQRARMMALLGARVENDQALGSLALDRLIEDRLKLQAAESAGLKPTAEVVAKGLDEFARQVGTDPATFRRRMAEAGVSEQALADMFGPQMLWRDYVTERFRGRIELGEAEIDAEIALAVRGQPVRFRVREIGLPFNDAGRSEAETRALADRLYRELSSGGDFAGAVRRYSRAPSAPRGGEVGWIVAADLPPQVLQVLTDVGPAGVTAPQPVPGGLSILQVTERETASVSGVDAADGALREQVRRELMLRRLDLLAQGLIQELRRDALIELR